MGTIIYDRVLAIFQEICALPHGSGHCEAITRYCMEFACRCGLAAQSDDFGNVVIRKPASTGCESRPPLMLQAHLDMVCESDKEQVFDFTKDPIRTEIRDGFLTACGTTLGADDGIGVAMILAILESASLSHPALEAVFTTEEETGMDGATGLSPSLLSAKRMINLDSEEEGILTVGCAGGTGVTVSCPLEMTDNDRPCYHVVVDGLHGGHSGTEINSGRSNAIRVMGQVLSFVGPLSLVSVSGGTKVNAIPRRCEAVVAAKRDPNLRLPLVLPMIQNAEEPDLSVRVEPVETAPLATTDLSTGIALSLLQSVPNGVQSERDGQVTTSLNLGILTSNSETMTLQILTRSCSCVELDRLLTRMQRIAREHGATYADKAHNAPWEPKQDSPLRETLTRVYERQYGSLPLIQTVHAGLECGVFADKIRELDAVSMGPTILGAHTVEERVSLPSVERTVEFLCRALAEC